MANEEQKLPYREKEKTLNKIFMKMALSKNSLKDFYDPENYNEESKEVGKNSKENKISIDKQNENSLEEKQLIDDNVNNIDFIDDISLIKDKSIEYEFNNEGVKEDIKMSNDYFKNCKKIINTKTVVQNDSKKNKTKEFYINLDLINPLVSMNKVVENADCDDKNGKNNNIVVYSPRLTNELITKNSLGNKTPIFQKIREVDISLNLSSKEGEIMEDKTDKNSEVSQQILCKHAFEYNRNTPKYKMKFRQSSVKQDNKRKKDNHLMIIREIEKRNSDKGVENPKMINPFFKKTENTPDSFLTVRLTDTYYWKKHEEIWDSIESYKILNNQKNKEECNYMFENFFIPKFENEIVTSIFFKQNKVSSEKLVITSKILNPNLEINRWSESYKVALKRWNVDTLIPLITELQLKNEVEKLLIKYILAKREIILQAIEKSFNEVIKILKKIKAKRKK